jgi:hypothetical protein
MTDREKRIEHQIFQHLAKTSDVGGFYNLNAIYNELYKSDGLLTPAAFDQGRLIRIDELRVIIRKLAADGVVWPRESLDWINFSLTDAGVVELQRRRSDDPDFQLSPDEAEEQRWQRLKSIVIGANNFDSVSRLIDRSLDELSKAQLTNEQHRQAASYMLAAKELVNAPSPPSQIVWDLIQKAAAIAGLVQTVLMIFSSLM